VRVYTRIIGEIEIGGFPSGSSFVSLRVDATANPGIVDWVVPGLSPPTFIDVDESFVAVVDTTVGATLQVDGTLDADLGATSVDPGDSVTNKIDINSRVTIGYETGFEDIVIASEAGAPIAPAPTQLPALGAAALAALAGFLVLSGAWMVADGRFGAAR
jgi:hypothetical protein